MSIARYYSLFLPARVQHSFMPFRSYFRSNPPFTDTPSRDFRNRHGSSLEEAREHTTIESAATSSLKAVMVHQSTIMISSKQAQAYHSLISSSQIADENIYKISGHTLSRSPLSYKHQSKCISHASRSLLLHYAAHSMLLLVSTSS